MKTIQGLESYSYDEVVSIITDYINEVLENNDFTDVEGIRCGTSWIKTSWTGKR